MEPAIRFWTDVFARYDSNRILLHDRENLAVVWKVIELPTEEDGTINRTKARDATNAASEELTKRLKRLERTGKAKDDQDELLLAVVGEEPGRLAGAWARVRAQRGIAGNFRLGIDRSKKWLPRVEAILKKNGVPRELRALPFIESTFNPLARSSAGAAGLWQLMPATARQLGLRVDRKVDERLDVLKATQAAAKMLDQNYDMLDSWPLAITGYNHGPYGMQRAVKAVGSNDITVLIAKYRKRTWGFASKNFYVEFLAALRLVEKIEAAEIARRGSSAGTDAPAALID